RAAAEVGPDRAERSAAADARVPGEVIDGHAEVEGDGQKEDRAGDPDFAEGRVAHRDPETGKEMRRRHVGGNARRAITQTAEKAEQPGPGHDGAEGHSQPRI